MTAPNDNEIPDFSNVPCRGRPVHWWYPADKPTREQLTNTRTAISICRGCLVQHECLVYSLKWEPVGIWGGFTESERHRIRKEKKISCLRPVGGVRTSKRLEGLDIAWDA